MKEKAKRPLYKRRWFIVISALFVIGLLGSIFESEESKQERAAEEAAVEQKKIDRELKKQQKKEEAEKLKEEEKRKEAAEKERKANLPFDQKIVENNSAVEEATFEDGILTLKSEVKSFWDETSILKSDAFDLFDVLGKSFKNDEVNQVNVVLSTEMIDNKGNKSIEDIVKYSYSRSTFEELNFDNFKELALSQTWRIFNESDSYWIHPGIYKNVKADYTSNLQYGLAKQ